MEAAHGGDATLRRRRAGASTEEEEEARGAAEEGRSAGNEGGGTAAGDGAQAARGRRKLRVPAAYRARLLAAFGVLGLAIAARVALRRPVPLRWIVEGVRYERRGADGRAAFSFFVSPFPVWVALYRFVVFMLRRPGRA